MSDEKKPLSSREEKVEKKVQKRPKRRSSVDGFRNVLTVEGKEDGYVYRVVNDTGDRVAAFEDAGYEVVTHDVKVGQSRAGRAKREPGSPHVISVGGGQKAILMRQKQEWYDEDQDAKAARVKKIEDQMKPGKGGDSDYGKIDIERK